MMTIRESKENRLEAVEAFNLQDLISYEQGELDEQETIGFFQGLVNSGLAWELQGSYGRTAHALLTAGLITLPGVTLQEVV